MALNAKKLRVLALLKKNNMDLEEISNKVPIDLGVLYDLIGGVGQHADPEFTRELRKVDQLVEERINRKALETKEICLKRLAGWVKSKSSHEFETKTRHRQLVDAVNALSKATPNINIEQYTWKQGMSQEEVANEFRRLKGLAGAAAIRRRVQKLKPRGSEEVSLRGERADSDSEAEQDIALRAKPETEGFSRKPSLGTGNFWGQ
jgi:hypothetical protein